VRDRRATYRNASVHPKRSFFEAYCASLKNKKKCGSHLADCMSAYRQESHGIAVRLVYEEGVRKAQARPLEGKLDEELFGSLARGGAGARRCCWHSTSPPNRQCRLQDIYETQALKEAAGYTGDVA